MPLSTFQAATLAEQANFRNAVRIHLMKAAAAIAANPSDANRPYALKVLRGEYDLIGWAYAVASSHILMNDQDVTLGDSATYGITSEIQTAVESLIPAFAAAASI